MKNRLLLSILLAFALSGCFSYDDGSSTPEADATTPPPSTDVTTPDPGEDASTETPDVEETPSYTGPIVPTLASCEEAEELGRTFVPGPSCDFELPLASGIRDRLPSCGGVSGRETSAPKYVRAGFGSHRSDRDLSLIWHTDADTRISEVRLGTDPENLDQLIYGFSYRFAGLDERGADPVDQRVVHQARVCGLNPNTTYYYQVGGDGVWSDVYAVSTGLPADSVEPYRFAVSGDTRNPTNEPWNRALERIHDFGVDFHLFSGDAVDVGPVQEQWDSWFTASDPWLAEQIFLPANGNHEFMAMNYVAQFALPGDGEHYWVRYGNGLFIIFNDLPLPDFNRGIATTVRDFMIDAFEQNQDATWRAVVHHRPMYSASTRHGSDQNLRDALGPLMDQYNVDFVFAGHDHNYERSVPVRNQQPVAQGQGTVYVVAAGIGAPLYDNGQEFWTATSERVSSFVIMDIDGNTARLRAYRIDGTLLDEYTLTK